MRKDFKVGLIVLLIFTLVVGMAGLLVGCGGTSEPGGEADGDGAATTPQRIISFFPSNTEILVALGLADNLVAVTIYDDYPADIRTKVEYVFEDGLNPNVEKALSLEPDLIVFGAHSEELIAAFAKFDIKTVQYDPQSIDAVYETITDLGAVTNRSKEASTLVAQMKNKQSVLAKIVDKIPANERKTVWMEISSDLWTVGTDTFMNELISNAGGINIVDQSGWVQYSEEKVLEQDPDIIFTTYGSYDPDAIENVLNREGWSALTAVKAKNVYDLDNNLVSRQGPRIVDAMWLLASKLYPELFTSENNDQAA